jgi:hypothetical protein
MPGMFPLKKTDYLPLFTEDGLLACDERTMDRFGFPVLPNSRGAFLKV